MGTNTEAETVTRALAAAVEQVQIDIGAVVGTAEGEAPLTSSLAAAALLLAVRILKSPEAAFGVAAVFDGGGIYVAKQDVNYQRLIKGHRRRFGIA
jgi:hypothetical protein